MISAALSSHSALHASPLASFLEEEVPLPRLLPHTSAHASLHALLAGPGPAADRASSLGMR